MSITTEYAVGTAYDEAFDDDGTPREHYALLHAELDRLGTDDLGERRGLVDAAYVRQGTTFTAYGDDPGTERPFPLDLVPRIVPAGEWAALERGLAQRVLALDLFLRDVYGRQRILRDRVLPRDLVVLAPGFRAAAVGLEPPGGVYVHVCGSDLIRDGDGTWRVLEDNCRIPSGVSYLLENRLVLKRALPSLFHTHAVRPIDHYPALLLRALASLAPRDTEEPVVVVLTPGQFSSAYFEHAFLARQLGVPLVEGRDLLVDDNQVFMRTTSGLRRVDVVYRRVDDDFLDPLAFRPDSLLGAPGLVNAARAGTVALANAIGTGVADDKAIYPYVPDMIRYYLAEEPLLEQVETFRAREPSHLSHILAHADELVIKATDGAGGAGMLIGPHVTAEERSTYLEEVRARPEGFVAQPVIPLSTCPCLIDGHLEPRHVDLRPFVVQGRDGISIVPGGLTRVALRRGSLVVNSSQGGGSKDTWVLADDGRTLSTAPPR